MQSAIVIKFWSVLWRNVLSKGVSVMWGINGYNGSWVHNHMAPSITKKGILHGLSSSKNETNQDWFQLGSAYGTFYPWRRNFINKSCQSTTGCEGLPQLISCKGAARVLVCWSTVAAYWILHFFWLIVDIVWLLLGSVGLLALYLADCHCWHCYVFIQHILYSTHIIVHCWIVDHWPSFLLMILRWSTHGAKPRPCLSSRGQQRMASRHQKHFH